MRRLLLQAEVLRFCVMAKVAGNGLPFRLCQRWEPSLADEPLHLWQDFFPFSHGSEAWVWNPMPAQMGRPVTCSATLRKDPPILSVQVWNSSKARTGHYRHERQKPRDSSSNAGDTPDCFPDTFSHVLHHTRF